MNILETIVSEIVGFLGVTQAWDILKTGDYSLFRTYNGVVSLIYPIIPFLLIFELILGLIYKKPQTRVYKVMYLIMPPGWSHTGEHHTAAIIRGNYLTCPGQLIQLDRASLSECDWDLHFLG